VTSWAGFLELEPELGTAVLRCFGVRKHCTIATLRKDGSPRISGTEVEFRDGAVWLGSMPNAVKALDLRRDGRFALHSPSLDPPEGEPWLGEAKLAGVAVDENEPGSDGHRFRLDLDEVVHVHLSDGLVVESWHPRTGHVVRRR
jgi:hypothetical protein